MRTETATLLVTLLLLPGVSSAQTLEAPEVVQANVDGSFSYQATFTAGPLGDEWAFYANLNLENTNQGFIADAFCDFPLGPNEQLADNVAGFLLDPDAEGLVEVQFSTQCPNGSGLFLLAVTRILPFSGQNVTPTPTPTSTAPPDCPTSWPLTQIITVGKGQGVFNNPKVVHIITGNIVDPSRLVDSAHRISVCTGTRVDVTVIDTTGSPILSRNSSGISCSGSTCVVQMIGAKEKYTARSADGTDIDRITLLPR